MKIKYRLLIVSLALIPVLLFGTKAPGATVIQWILGEVGPPSWSIQPPSPTTDDTIGFSGPTDKVYPNHWVCEAAGGGSPTITIDSLNHEVKLWFEPPPPDDIPTLWEPISGLQGSFGPLEEGDWTFYGDNPVAIFSIPFQVIPEPAALYLLIFCSLALFHRRQ